MGYRNRKNKKKERMAYIDMFNLAMLNKFKYEKIYLYVLFICTRQLKTKITYKKKNSYLAFKI